MIFLAVAPYTPHHVRDVRVMSGMASTCLRHLAVGSKEAVRASLIKKKESAGALLIY